MKRRLYNLEIWSLIYLELHTFIFEFTSLSEQLLQGRHTLPEISSSPTTALNKSSLPRGGFNPSNQVYELESVLESDPCLHPLVETSQNFIGSVHDVFQ